MDRATAPHLGGTCGRAADALPLCSLGLSSCQPIVLALVRMLLDTDAWTVFADRDALGR
ncbi:MAG: hypothetical protein U1E76_16800 [Planctomycetota bacterium]